MGRLTADPELKQTPNGVSVTSFTIAVDRDYAKTEEKMTDFINIVAWRGTAEFICKFFKKGRLIILSGSLQVRNYTTKEGEKRYVSEVVADKVYFAGDRENTERTQNKGVVDDANEPDIDYGDLPF